MSSHAGIPDADAIPETVATPDPSRAPALYVRNTQSSAKVGARGIADRTLVIPTAWTSRTRWAIPPRRGSANATSSARNTAKHAITSPAGTTGSGSSATGTAIGASGPTMPIPESCP